VIYEQLFRRAGDRKVRAALIGTGMFGTSLLAQGRVVPRLDLRVVCDRSAEALEKACREAGIPRDEAVRCGTAAEARAALDRGRTALVSDAALVAELPVEVVIECTGNPESGARYAEAAILAGKHVAVVTKEADAVVGPVLHAMAGDRGVVYTPVDGDQHGLMTGMFLWARALGFNVHCGGKAREADFVVDEASGTVTGGRRSMVVAERDRRYLGRAPRGAIAEFVAERRRALSGLPLLRPADVCEMVIAANHTGLVPDRPEMHAPALRIVEVAEALCPESEGGILSRSGVVDMFICLRRSDEPGMMGGEFIVIENPNGYSRQFLGHKGMLTNASGSAALVYKPLHLLGVEAPISVLCAGLAGMSTGAPEVLPRVDVVGRARRDLAAGTVLLMEEIEDGGLFQPLMVPAAAASGDAALPLYMAAGLRLTRSVPAGSMLTVSAVEAPGDSRLWALRREQDRRLLR
jgi:predicted homoserine dehydrogenase-like protein